MAGRQTLSEVPPGGTDLLDKPSNAVEQQEVDAFAEFLSRLDRRYETLNAQLDTLLSGLRPHPPSI